MSAESSSQSSSDLQAALADAAQSLKSGGGISHMDTTTLIALVTGVASIIGTTVQTFYSRMKERELQQELQNIQLDFEARQRKAQRFENINELMLSYKKPLLLAAFDLQARFANQVKSAFLYDFVHQRPDQPRDGEYAVFNTAYVIAEFLGWLEVIRQEVTFITGDADAESLNNLFDAIKFQFTGQTPIQGVGGRSGEEGGQLLQMYAGELRAVGEVMLVPHGDGHGHAPMGYALFLKRMSTQPPPDDATLDALKAWLDSDEHELQTAMAVVMRHVRALADMKQAPRRRMAILQVLLCKLIDLLDASRPYQDPGKPPYNDGDEPQYLRRDFRMVPLVNLLSEEQMTYMRTLEVFRTEDPEVQFPGFAAHLPPTMPQAERDRILGWRNACPPLQPRFRVARGKVPKQQPFYVTGPAAVAKSFTDAFARSFHRAGHGKGRSHAKDEEEGEEGPLIKAQPQESESAEGSQAGPGIVVMPRLGTSQESPSLPGQPTASNRVMPV